MKRTTKACKNTGLKTIAQTIAINRFYLHWEKFKLFMSVEEKLEQLGYQLPTLPTSKGIYKRCLIDGNHLYVSGHISVNSDGSSITGKLGKDLNEADQLFFDQIVEEAVRVETLKQAAEANPIDKFQMVFREVLQSLFIDRMDMNEELFANYMNEPEFREQVAEWLGQQVYHRLPKSVAYPQEKPSIKRAKPRSAAAKSVKA